MVDRTSNNVAAQILPVAARIDKMEMPGLIHLVRRRQLLLGERHHRDESPVFGRDTVSKVARPSVLCGQPPLEREVSAILAYDQASDPPDEDPSRPMRGGCVFHVRQP